MSYIPATLAQGVGGENLAAAGLLCLGVILISAFLLMRLRKRAQHGPSHPTAREQLERYKQRDGVKDDLNLLMVEIEQLAKRLGAQLDAKAHRLESLLDEADLRIAQLQQAYRAEHQAPENPSIPSAPPAPPVPPVHPAPPPIEPKPAGAQSDPLKMEIYRLADEGRSATEIARHTTEHIGKVELILALRTR